MPPLSPTIRADASIRAAAVEVSGSSFAREASLFLSELRATYRDCLCEGNDEGVYRAVRAARTVEQAACVHVSARSLAGIRARRHSDEHRMADSAATKEYLIGVQNRLHNALKNKDIAALQRIADAADSVMNHLAHPENTFADLEERAYGAAAIEARVASVERGIATDIENCRNYDEAFARGMSGQGGFNPLANNAVDDMRSLGSSNSGVSTSNSKKKRRRCLPSFFSFKSLNHTERAVFFLYLLMILAALVSVGFITHQFIEGIINPESFLRSTVMDKLAMPVVTLCLSRPGIPFSRLQVFNFTDANGTHHRGADPYGDYFARRHQKFDDAVERFWENPGNEDCNKTVGDFFPFDTVALNSLARGDTRSECRPCYRFGYKHPIDSTSTDFKRASFISVFTDNYALECLKRPGGLTFNSRRFLTEIIVENLRSRPSSLIAYDILNRTDGGLTQGLTEEHIEIIDGKKLCNIFYFALFPKELRKLAPNDTQIKYSFNATGAPIIPPKWTFTGTGPEFVPPKPKMVDTDFFPLESMQMFISHREHVQNKTVRGEKDMILIGPNTQTFVTLEQLKVYNDSRFDASTSTSNFVDSEVVPLFGYWLNYRIFYNYNRFIINEYYRESTYTVLQWLIDFTGYLSLFTGASIFSVLLLPTLVAMKRVKRNQMKKENPEAYVLRKYRKKFGFNRGNSRDASSAGSNDGEREAISSMLP